MTIPEEHYSDCKAIIELAKTRLGVTISINDAYALWSEHSDTYAAGWLLPNSEEEIIDAIQRYIIDSNRLTIGEQNEEAN